MSRIAILAVFLTTLVVRADAQVDSSQAIPRATAALLTLMWSTFETSIEGIEERVDSLTTWHFEHVLSRSNQEDRVANSEIEEKVEELERRLIWLEAQLNTMSVNLAEILEILRRR